MPLSRVWSRRILFPPPLQWNGLSGDLVLAFPYAEFVMVIVADWEKRYVVCSVRFAFVRFLSIGFDRVLMTAKRPPVSGQRGNRKSDASADISHYGFEARTYGSSVTRSISAQPVPSSRSDRTRAAESVPVERLLPKLR